MAASEPAFKFGTSQEHLPTCDKHGKRINMDCEDCNKFVCTDCAKTDHRDHNWVTASQRRRQLGGFIKSIKEEKVSEIDRKIENTSIKMKEMEKQSDSEIQKLQKHYHQIITKLTEIKTRHERTIRVTLIEKSERINRLKTQYIEQRKNLDKKLKLIEERNSTMSDYDLLENHRELLKQVSAEDVNTEICEYSLRYSCGHLLDEELDSVMGQMFDLQDISATETNSYPYSDGHVWILNACDENESYVKLWGLKYIELINKQGDKKDTCNVTANDICVTDNVDVFYTDRKNTSIARLSPSKSVSTVFNAHPLEPVAICQSLDVGLLVTLVDSEKYELDSRSRRLIVYMTLTGDVIGEYEYQEDGQTRLFTLPRRVQQNGNSDICVVNATSDTTGNLVILSSSGRLRTVYNGQNPNTKFYTTSVVCDSCYSILITDHFNHRIHLLSPDGEFVKFLLTENEVYEPTAMSLYESTLWVGNFKGIVKVFQFKY